MNLVAGRARNAPTVEPSAHFEHQCVTGSTGHRAPTGSMRTPGKFSGDLHERPTICRSRPASTEVVIMQKCRKMLGENVSEVHHSHCQSGDSRSEVAPAVSCGPHSISPTIRMVDSSEPAESSSVTAIDLKPGSSGRPAPEWLETESRRPGAGFDQPCLMKCSQAGLSRSPLQHSLRGCRLPFYRLAGRTVKQTQRSIRAVSFSN